MSFRSQQSRGQVCLRTEAAVSPPAIRQIVGLCLSVVAISILGCGPSGPATTPVSGTVTVNGTPVERGIVRFNPVDPKIGRPSQANLGPGGKFTMETFKSGDGVMAGEYTITVTSTMEDSEALAKDKGTGVGGKSAIPERYGNPKTSGFSETIANGKPVRDLVLDLEDK